MTEMAHGGIVGKQLTQEHSWAKPLFQTMTRLVITPMRVSFLDKEEGTKEVTGTVYICNSISNLHFMQILASLVHQNKC